MDTTLQGSWADLIDGDEVLNEEEKNFFLFEIRSWILKLSNDLFGNDLKQNKARNCKTNIVKRLWNCSRRNLCVQMLWIFWNNYSGQKIMKNGFGILILVPGQKESKCGAAIFCDSNNPSIEVASLSFFLILSFCCRHNL